MVATAEPAPAPAPVTPAPTPVPPAAAPDAREPVRHPVATAPARPRVPRTAPSRTPEHTPAAPAPAATPDPVWETPEAKEVWDLARMKPEDGSASAARLHALILRFHKAQAGGPYLRRAEEAAEPLLALRSAQGRPLQDHDPRLRRRQHLLPPGRVHLPDPRPVRTDRRGGGLRPPVRHRPRDRPRRPAARGPLPARPGGGQARGGDAEAVLFADPAPRLHRGDGLRGRSLGLRQDEAGRPEPPPSRWRSSASSRATPGPTNSRTVATGSSRSPTPRPRTTTSAHPPAWKRIKQLTAPAPGGLEARAMNAAEAETPASRSPSAVAAPRGPVRSVSAGK